VVESVTSPEAWITTLGGSHLALIEPWPEQPALQSASTSHVSGFGAASQTAAVYATLHPPLHVASAPQLTFAVASSLQSPVQVPSQVAEHLPSQFPAQVPLD